MLGVVLLDEVRQDRAGLPGDGSDEHGLRRRCGIMDVPKHEVVVLVVDDRGDTSVRVVLRVLGGLVLTLAEVEVDGVVGQTELLEDGGDLPAKATRD